MSSDVFGRSATKLRGEFSLGMTFHPAECPECKKVFQGRKGWAYAIGDTRFCSYTCMRKAQAKRKKTSEELRIAAELSGKVYRRDGSLLSGNARQI